MTPHRPAPGLFCAGLLAALLASPVRAAPPEGSGTPAQATATRAAAPEWGVQLAGSFSREQALASFDRVRMMLPSVVPDTPPVIVGGPLGNRGPGPFYRARIRAGTRSAADDLCTMIRSAGGRCVVLPMRAAE